MTRQEVVTAALASIERHVPNAEARAAILADLVRLLIVNDETGTAAPTPRRR